MYDLYYLDAKTRLHSNRITAFSDSLEDLMHNYQDWIRDMDLRQKDMWYANVFEVGTNRHMGYMRIGAEEEITYTPVENSKVNPFRRNLRQWIDWVVGVK